jgi:hypothetical protein
MMRELKFLKKKKRIDCFFSSSLTSFHITQVVTLSTYSFVIACIFGRQCIENGSKDISIDVYFPLWTVLQILFYMGLLKMPEHQSHFLAEKL